MSVLTAVTGLLALVPAFLKHKKFVLWYKGPDRQPYLLSNFAILRDGVNPGPGWIKKSGAMSSRQCAKTRDALWMLGP